ncbi:MAG: acyl carrier protein [Longimicrobiales bacterium]
MRDRLKRYIGEQLLNDGNGSIADQDDLLESGIDSVAMMTLVLFIEEEWKVAVPPEDVILENFQSVAAIETYLKARLAAAE